MTWVDIANLRGLPGDAASLAELANRPKSTTASLAAGTNINTYHQQQHVGWWPFIAADVTGEPDGLGVALQMLEVIAPSPYAAVQRVHDRNARTTWERSIINVADNQWSSWRAFAMTDRVLSIMGIIGTSETVKGNVDDYFTAAHLGIWTLWAPYNTGIPKDTRGRCTLEVIRDSNGSIVQRLIERESGRSWTRTYSGGFNPWVELSSGPLQPFWNAVAKSKSQPVNVVVVGDSNSEGYGLVDNLSERWINKLQPALNRIGGNWQGAEWPFIPAKYNTTNPGNMPVELTGNYITGSYTWGFGWRTATLRDETSKAVFTFFGTSATVMYVEGINGGLMNIQVDDNPVVVVDTNSATTAASRLWNTGALPVGTHTVTVTWNSANAGSGDLVYLEGLLTWNNDETRGVRIIDASFTGRQLNDLTPERNNNLCRAMTQMGGVELVIVNLVTNDTRWDTPLDTYRANAEDLINQMRIYGLSVPVVFVVPFVGADHERSKLNTYGAILSNTASNFRGVHFVDLSLDMPKIPADRSLPEAQGLYIDALHMSNQGHTQFAGHMLRSLQGS
ncbi:GDSL-type esterase/lipase family protein [Glutamicibacter nicotianae]|uniref:GDSL-type esterase/lipase family protein n=1 Tax=Glutamicibacter nicotianae TaxID=37929 RepID=UPI00167F7F98|nr:GDSL-type esterase/lipase family protein [Glutamicibacter nicotianae]